MIRKAAFLDVETTGFRPPEDEIIEIAIALISFNDETWQLLDLLQKYSGLRQPSFPIPKQATKVNGITDREVKGKRLDNRAILKIINQADIMVAHNAKFDYQFTIYYLPEFEQKPWHCSMEQVKWPGGLRALKEIAKSFGLEGAVKHHRAIHDVALMVDLLNKSDEQGNTYFKQLLDAGPMPENKLIKFKPIRL